MRSENFLIFFDSIYKPSTRTVDDLVDSLNAMSAIFLLGFAMILGSCTYLLNFISCYTPVAPSGENVKDFISNYCFVHGTIALHRRETIPSTDEHWDLYDKQRRTNYYQWVPFVLSLQCVFFFGVRMTWDVLQARQAGGDLKPLVKIAKDGAAMNQKDRKEEAEKVANFIHDLLHSAKDLQDKTSCYVARLYSRPSWLKRYDISVFMSYMLYKTILMLNLVIQLWLTQEFLGFVDRGAQGSDALKLSKDPYNESPVVPLVKPLTGWAFGLTLYRRITSGQEWPETLIFPRVAYCRIPGIRLVGLESAYTAQCALPLNMINEKVYISLWFWFITLIVLNTCSTISWLIAILPTTSRQYGVERLLNQSPFNQKDPAKEADNVLQQYRRSPNTIISLAHLRLFVRDYLKIDGFFLIEMFRTNVGEVFTSVIVEVLYENYCEKAKIVRTSSIRVESDVDITADGEDSLLKEKYKDNSRRALYV